MIEIQWIDIIFTYIFAKFDNSENKHIFLFQIHFAYIIF